MRNSGNRSGFFCSDFFENEKIYILCFEKSKTQFCDKKFYFFVKNLLIFLNVHYIIRVLMGRKGAKRVKKEEKSSAGSSW